MMSRRHCHLGVCLALSLMLTGCLIREPPPLPEPTTEAIVVTVITPPTRPPVPTVVHSERVLGEAGLRWPECALWLDDSVVQAEHCLPNRCSTN